MKRRERKKKQEQRRKSDKLKQSQLSLAFPMLSFVCVGGWNWMDGWNLIGEKMKTMKIFHSLCIRSWFSFHFPLVYYQFFGDGLDVTSQTNTFAIEQEVTERKHIWKLIWVKWTAWHGKVRVTNQLNQCFLIRQMLSHIIPNPPMRLTSVTFCTNHNVIQISYVSSFCTFTNDNSRSILLDTIISCCIFVNLREVWNTKNRWKVFIIFS